MATEEKQILPAPINLIIFAFQISAYMDMVQSGRRVLFHRFFNIYNGGTSGGQIKVRDCFEHIRQSDSFFPQVYFNPLTVWFENPGNVWRPYRNSPHEAKNWDIKAGDLIFFAGVDWMILNEKQSTSPPVPVINIAHPRHTMPTDKRNAYLKNPAIRITKSSISKKILDDYGVNGPVFIIPDAIDPADLPQANEAPDLDLLIVGLKNPGLAKKLSRRLKWHNFITNKKIKFEVQLPPKLPTRSDFLNLVNRAKTVVYLPLEEKFGSEGFYLPALEGMFLKKLVICPYAVGNIDFCIAGETCLMPQYDLESIMLAIHTALNMDEENRSRIIQNALEITVNHLLENEKKSLINLLNQADDIWNQKDLFL